VQAPGGLDKAAAVGDGEESARLVDIHASAQPFKSNISILSTK
jgi:hypothetical protein